MTKPCSITRWFPTSSRFNIFMLPGADLSPRTVGDCLAILDNSPDWWSTDGSVNRSLSDEAEARAETPGCCNTESRCITRAIETMRSLHTCPSACLSSGLDPTTRSRPLQGVDTILSAVQEAIHTATGLVKCSCFAKLQLQLPMVVVCDKIIAWYRTVMRTYSDRDSGLGPSSSLPGLGLFDANPRVPEVAGAIRRPFSIGSHCVDGHLEATLVAQVISARLQELESLVDVIGRQMADYKSQSPGDDNVNTNRSGSTPGNAALLDIIRVRLLAHLRVQLDATRRELATLPSYGAAPGSG